MAELKNQTFSDQTVDMDGNTYDGCKFERCVLRYSGNRSVQLNGCRFEGCTLSLDGAAANTIGYLAAIHQGLGDWGKNNVENLIKAIRGDMTGIQKPDWASSPVQ